MKKGFALLLVLILGYGAIFAVSRWLDAHQPESEESFTDEDLYFSSQQINLFSSDFKGLLADWYWIKSLQYLGGKIVRQQDAQHSSIDINNLRPLNPRLVYPMLDTAATLDPQFMTIYSYGASVLPAIDPQEAIKLLEKGIAANPDEWRLYQNLGYIYWQSKDYENAAKYYTEGAAKPGAPPFMKQISINMQAEGGSKDFALQVYKQMFETAEDEQTKSFAELRYNSVLSQKQLDFINQSLQNYKEKTSRCANSLIEMLPVLNAESRRQNIELQVDNAQNLVDPTGVPYEFDKNSCTAKLNSNSKIPVF